jgi:parvulin-like peptidyl-prolyl isomerase
MALTDTDVIASVFDEGFAKHLLRAPTGQWFGPVRSQYGVHLVIVGEKTAGRAPSLADVRTPVQSDWESARRKEIADKRYAEMRQQYDVKIELPANMATSPVETSGVK